MRAEYLWWVQTWGVAEGGGRRCRRESFWSENGKSGSSELFLFQMCISPHMVLVLAYILRISVLTFAPAFQTDMALDASLPVGFDPVTPEVRGHRQGAAN